MPQKTSNSKSTNAKKISEKTASLTIWLAPILIFGGILRIYNNTALSLWHDEAFSALYIKYSWGEMMYRIGLDVHPPLYYWLLRLWSYIFGSGLFSLRAMSILLGLLTIYMGYLFVKKAFNNEKFALVAALFIAINPFQIHYALEARMYTLGTFLLLFASWILLLALENNKIKYWIGFAVLTAASLYTHYFLLFSTAAHGLYAIYYLHKTGKLKTAATAKMLGSFLLGAILYIPWVPVMLQQVSRVQESFWITAPDRWSIPSTLWKMAFGGLGNDKITLTAAAIAAVIAIYYFCRETKPLQRWLILSAVFVPMAGALGLSFVQAIYLDRYFVFSSLFYSILIAAGIYAVPKYTTRRALVITFAALSIVLFFKNWHDMGVKNLVFNREVNHKPGMAAASAFINDNATPNDKIYVGSSFVFFTFKYYNQTPIQPLLYSPGSLDSIPHFSGTAILTDNDLLRDFTQVQSNDTVWLLWTTGYGGSKPVVPGNWDVIQEKQYADAPDYKGLIVVTQYHIN